MFLRGSLPSTVLALLTAAPLLAQDPVAYWDFESGYTSAVDNGTFQGTPIGPGVTIAAVSGPFGTRALRLDDAAGASPLYMPVLDTTQSNFTFSGTSSLGPIQGVPNNRFQGSGSVNLTLNPATGGTFTMGQFTGGNLGTIPSTISARVPNPIPFLPPLASVDIINARFGFQSGSFAIGAGGGFSTSLVLVPLSGQVVLTPLAGSQTTIDLSTLTASTPTTVAGTIRDVNGRMELVVPLNNTFNLDTGTGITATLTIQGQAFATEPVHRAVPSYVDVANPVIAPGQPEFSIVAWYRHVDFANNGSAAVNVVCETVDPSFVTTASSLRLQGSRSATAWIVDDQSVGTLVGDDGTAVDSNWHHVALTFSQGNRRVRFYVDGTLIGETTTSGAPIEPSTGFHIGASALGSGVGTFDGFLDEVAVFDRELEGSFVAGLASGTFQVMARPYGVACQNLTVSASESPRLGSTGFTVGLAGAPANAPALLVFGDSRTSFPPLTLPFDLAALGAPGCFLNASIVFELSTIADASGAASFTLPIPANTSLLGATVYDQWAVFAPGSNTLGLVFSEGLEVKVIR